MLDKILGLLYLKIFVNIVIHKEKIYIYIESSNAKEIVDSSSQDFDISELNTKVYKYINSQINATPFFYISILDYKHQQGVIPSCNKSDISKFCDLENPKTLCFENNYRLYTSNTALDEIKSEHKKLGVDFIFSPFSVLSMFFNDKLKNNLALFVLVEEEHISLTVYDNGKLLYAKYLVMEHYNSVDDLVIDDIDDDLELDIDLEDDSIDIDDIDALDELDDLESIGELDEFGDIEDLDSLDEIDEFADTKDLEEELSQEVEEEMVDEKSLPMEDVDNFSNDYDRYVMIQDSLDDFYKDTRYESSFVEHIYIADSIGVSGDLKKYLEEEMFLTVYIRQIDIGMEICELAKLELK